MQMECDYGGASAILESVHGVSVIMVEQVQLLNQFMVYGIGSLQTCFKDHLTGKRPHLQNVSPPPPSLQELCYGPACLLALLIGIILVACSKL
jgi:hypothetical protein